MLLGSGNLLDKLPLTQTGGVIKNTNWMNPSISMVGVDTFDNKSSLPNGYGGRAFYLPLKAGGLSSCVANIGTLNANGNNGTASVTSEIIATLGGLVNLSGTITTMGTLGGTLQAIANADGSITLLSTVSGDIVSVLNGLGSSVTLTTIEGAIVGAVNGIAPSTVSITINADMVGIFGGSVALISTSALGIAVLDGKANAIIGLTATNTASGTLLAKGYMGGSTKDTSAGLTAKDVWEYYQRTLTSGGADGFTLTQIADAVWNKTL